ncbi:MAG: hypothetical protein ACLGI3_12310, partial [Actinomycetes bacterium]
PPVWRRAAPWVAVAVVAITVVAVVATRGGDDDGTATGDAGAFVGGDLHTLVADPSSPERLFVGGHEAAASSADGGRIWAPVPSLRNADAMGWAFGGDTIWMGGHPGLRRSTDGGRTFEPAGGELAATDVHALGGGGGVLYAASPGHGVLASNDDGESWEVRSAEAGRGFMGAIVVDDQDVEHLFAPDMQAGVVESTDGGRTWRPLGSPGMAMSVAAAGDGELIVAGGGQAARSTDGGRTWSPLEVPEGTMVVTAASDSTLYAAVLDGDTASIFASADGETWTPRN